MNRNKSLCGNTCDNAVLLVWLDLGTQIMYWLVIPTLVAIIWAGDFLRYGQKHWLFFIINTAGYFPTAALHF